MRARHYPPDQDGTTTSVDPTGARRAGYALVLLVMGCVTGADWSGLYEFARELLGWSEGHAMIVPVALTGAAIACACLALDSVSRGDGALLFRFLLVGLVGLAAWINWYRVRLDDISVQVFFPAMSLTAWLMVEACFRKFQRDSRRRRGERLHTFSPLPRMGALAWIMHKNAAWQAVSDAVARRIPQIEAPAAVETPEPVVLRLDPAKDNAEQAAHRAYLAGLETKALAVQHAAAVLGSTDAGLIRRWLAEHGVDVARSYVHALTARADSSRTVQTSGQDTEQTSPGGEPELIVTDADLDTYATGKPATNGHGESL